MKKIVFVEEYCPGFDYSKSTVVALDIESHFKLMENRIDHSTVSEIVDFKNYLAYSDEYNLFQRKFFENCDDCFGTTKINVN